MSAASGGVLPGAGFGEGMEEMEPVEEPRKVSVQPTLIITPDEPSPWRQAFKIASLILLVIITLSAGLTLFLYGKMIGAKSPWALISRVPDAYRAFRDPKQYFPGKDRITVLCLGLDRNVLISRNRKLNGMFYTKGARSDVLMVASLDLKNQSISILSIPRDTRVLLPGRRGYSKINAAHAHGGVPYTRQAVEEFLGISIDHCVVIKQEAIKSVVDSLGGVRVRVEKDMDYDDNWGQLHVHLKAGEQLLNGEQVVGFMRFRGGEEGDLGRIRRQQQVIQSLSAQVKNPAVLLKAVGLIDAVRNHVDADLTPDQQLALANLFHRVDTGNIQTLSLPIGATEKIGGVDYLVADEAKKEAAVDWIVHGNTGAMNRLIRVELKNASGNPELYQTVYKYLRHMGFQAFRAGRVPGRSASSRVVQRTTLRGSGRRVLETLGLRGNVERSGREGADVTLIIGRDLERAPMLAGVATWPEVAEPVRRTASIRIPPPSPEGGVVVRVKSVEAPPEPPVDEPPGDDPEPALSDEPTGDDQPGEEMPPPVTPGTGTG